MTTPSIEEVARKLTKAQREAVTGRRWRWMSLRQALDWPMIGAVERMPDAPHFWQATPLGLALRAHLTAGATHDR